MKLRPNLWLILSLLISLSGVVWMQTAVSYYRHLTGRNLYGLAGYYYSVPELGFKYHPGGQVIHQWTTIIPTNVALLALALSLALALIVERKASWKTLVGIVLVHGLAGLGFGLIFVWYDIIVTGIFI